MRIISILLLLFFVAACSSDKHNYFKPLNLIEYDVPLTILAPDSVDVTKANLGVQSEVSIKSQNSDDYHVRIYFGEATGSLESTKTQQLKFLKETGIFSKVLLDEPNGFVYETAIDSSFLNYGFRRVVIMGTREYVFHSGSGTYTEEQAKEMYHSTLPQEVEIK